MPPILVTGAAGFIGFHTTKRLLSRGETIIGLDNLNDYYDVGLKEARLAQLSREERFEFIRADLSSKERINSVFESHRPDRVINLAAQAGVRYAFDNPHAYVDSNLMGFLNILEGCRHYDVKHLVYASSSSVYGANTSLPFSVEDNVDHPVSFYAVTKKANELMAHSYAHLYRIPTTGLRFFTVYGPWGRPDMAMFIFTKKILAGEPIDVFNNGQHSRDFTYIDDIVDGIVRSLDHVAEGDANWSGDAPNPATSNAPYRLFNIGNNQVVELMHLISCIEDALGRKAEKNFLPMQPGDVPRTFANIDALTETTGFAPTTSIEVGVKKFIDWYLSYYGQAS